MSSRLGSIRQRSALLEQLIKMWREAERVYRLQDKKRFVMAVLCWASLVTVVALQRLYVAPALSPLDWLMLFLVSTFAGLVLGFLEHIIFGFALTLVLSSLFMASILALPATLNLAGPLYGPVAERQAVVLVFQAFFPFTIVLLLVGGVIGGAISERFNLT